MTTRREEKYKVWIMECQRTYAICKIMILGNELQSQNICISGISETKFKAAAHFTMTDGQTILFSVGAIREHHGVTWVNIKTVPCMKFYNPANKRIILARNASKPGEETIIE